MLRACRYGVNIRLSVNDNGNASPMGIGGALCLLYDRGYTLDARHGGIVIITQG